MIITNVISCSCGEIIVFSFNDGKRDNRVRDEEIFVTCGNCGLDLLISIYYDQNDDVCNIVTTELV